MLCEGAVPILGGIANPDCFRRRIGGVAGDTSRVAAPVVERIAAPEPDGTTPLTRFQRLLVGGDGTVTHVLEAYADEPIEAIKLRQDHDVARDVDAPLELEENAAVLRRQVLLRGARTWRNLLHASAVLAIGRIGPGVLDGLLTTSKPIGRLLAESRTETFREVLEIGCLSGDPRGIHFGMVPSADLIFRTYRITSGGRPIMVVTEAFPATSFLGLAG